MKKFLTIVGMAVSLTAPAASAPALAADQPPPSLTASGEATEYAVPDMATVTIGVVSEARTARQALDANNADIAKVIDAIKGSGVAEKDIGTSGFNIGPVWSNPPPKPDGTQEQPKITGYQVTNQVQVVIRDLAKAGTVLDASVTAGANQAAQIDFGLADKKPVEDKAMTAAIADANRKAKLMADAAGVKLVRILSVVANPGGGGPFPVAMAMRAEKAVPIMSGERSISATATVTWEIGG
jgi:uncharacterized protein YggE